MFQNSKFWLKKLLKIQKFCSNTKFCSKYENFVQKLKKKVLNFQNLVEKFQKFVQVKQSKFLFKSQYLVEILIFFLKNSKNVVQNLKFLLEYKFSFKIPKFPQN